MKDEDLIRSACETNFAYLALGNERFEAARAGFVRNRKTPRRHDANGIGLVRAASPGEIEALLRRAETEFAGFGHRLWSIDPLTPPPFVATLALEDGYKPNDYLVLALEGELRAGSKPGIEVREVLTEDDWQAYRELDALWWQESGTDLFGPYDEALHDELLLNKHVKHPEARSWVASIDGNPRAFLTSWPGENGTGIVEDLFCHPDYRHRGLATALIVRCVADCRERGAGPVIISADPNETPKRMYAAMGFRPLYVHRTYTKRLDEQPQARLPSQGAG